ncbi:hypothetical protein QOT17_021557 [Balamuthia mandrillaris]
MEQQAERQTAGATTTSSKELRLQLAEREHLLKLLQREMQVLEVTNAELNSLPAGRAVYSLQGPNVFFPCASKEAISTNKKAEWEAKLRQKEELERECEHLKHQMLLALDKEAAFRQAFFAS